MVARKRAIEPHTHTAVRDTRICFETCKAHVRARLRSDIYSQSVSSPCLQRSHEQQDVTMPILLGGSSVSVGTISSKGYGRSVRSVSSERYSWFARFVYEPMVLIIAII